MRYWFDTEFIEDGHTIDLISIGIVAEDGRTYYAESGDVVKARASQWVIDNVFPHLEGNTKSRAQIAEEIVAFVGIDDVEFWAYYADYDWVALCQLYGKMINLPMFWPMYCRDVKQLCDDCGNPVLPEWKTEHHALTDAKWAKKAWEFLKKFRNTPTPLRDWLPEYDAKQTNTEE
jgi:3' exoribonuclease, RNase T-like